MRIENLATVSVCYNSYTTVPTYIVDIGKHEAAKILLTVGYRAVENMATKETREKKGGEVVRVGNSALKLTKRAQSTGL